ncbi:hypothetical protein, partial [Endozoicomonas sp. ONNA2]|uniref:hypothetical protein n=1 Tax=Endozoicomonas sp. ONNA2 TaxID=2828741 RepID=UPI0021490F87
PRYGDAQSGAILGQPPGMTWFILMDETIIFCRSYGFRIGYGFIICGTWRVVETTSVPTQSPCS